MVVGTKSWVTRSWVPGRVVGREIGLFLHFQGLRHPLLRRQIPLATMEAVLDNAENVTLFWELFNDVIQKVSDDDTRRSNDYSVYTCEFHFKDFKRSRDRNVTLFV